MNLFIQTYAVNKQVADSASTATAFLCGVKSNFYTIGLSAAATRDNCRSANGTEVDSVLVDAYKAGARFDRVRLCSSCC